MNKTNRTKLIFIAALLLLTVLLIILFIRSKYAEKAPKLYADNIIDLSQTGAGEKGFTCTGLWYDASTDTFYIGDAGKLTFEEQEFHANIKQVTKGFDRVIQTIKCYELSDEMKDVQGVCIDSDNNIWFCSCGEDLVRQIKLENGEAIGVSSFSIEDPSGIAYSKKENVFWILTKTKLLRCSAEGDVLNEYDFEVAGQDQLFYDEQNDVLYITAGADYRNDSYIYSFDIYQERFMLRYILKDSFAIEGISIVNGSIYIMNDGFYHDSKVPVNQVCIYNIPE